ILVAPNVLSFGAAEAQAGPLHRLVLLRRTDGRRLGRVVKVDAPAGIELVEAEAGAASELGAMRRMRVTLRPSKLRPDFRGGQLRVWLENEATPLTIRVTASPAKPMAAAVPRESGPHTAPAPEAPGGGAGGLPVQEVR